MEVSALEGRGVEAIMPLVVEAYAAWNKRSAATRGMGLQGRCGARPDLFEGAMRKLGRWAI